MYLLERKHTEADTELPLWFVGRPAKPFVATLPTISQIKSEPRSIIPADDDQPVGSQITDDQVSDHQSIGKKCATRVDLGHADPEYERFLRRPEVQRITSLSRSALYRLVAAREFPPPCRLAANTVAWRASSVYEWMATRVASSRKSRAPTPRGEGD